MKQDDTATAPGQHQRQRLTSAAWGELDEHSRLELQAHLEACVPCAAEYEFERRLSAALTTPASLPPALYFEGVLEEIHRGMPTRALPALPRRRLAGELRAQAGSAAFALLMLVWLGTAGQGLLGSGSSAGIGKTGSAQVACGPPPPRLIALESIGLVHMDSELLQLTERQWAALGLPELTARDREQLMALRRRNYLKEMEQG